MIRKEYYRTREDGVVLNKNYSDAGFRILQNETGVVYDEAIDVENAFYTYTETNELIEEIESIEATEEDYINALNELGVNINEEDNT